MIKKLFACFAAIALALAACSSPSEDGELPPKFCNDIVINTIPTEDFTFDDIKHWVGEGENRAIFIVKWNDGKEPDALVWGYKWNGTKYGLDMVMDILKADNRLFLLTHYTGHMGNTIAGFGYDISCNHIQLKDEDGNSHTPVDGIVKAYAYDYDGWTCADPAAHWASGWYTNGYWSYWVSDNGFDSPWEYSNRGASSRELKNNSVDAWYFDVIAFTDYDNSTYERCMARGEDCDGKEFFDNITPR